MKKLVTGLMALVMAATMTGVPAYAAESVDYSDKLSELKILMEQCEEKGIPTDYEAVSYATIERFEEYINQDLAKGIDSSVANYEKSSVEAIYAEAKANLEAYLNGSKTALDAEEIDMHNLSVDGQYIYYGNKPVFSIGYGFFGMAQEDIPNFQKFGVNNIQMEIGPHQTWGQGSNGWNIYNGVEGLNASATVVDEAAHSGSKALKFAFADAPGANRYVAAERVIPCKPNTTYTLGCWAKGTATDWNAWMTFDWVSSGRVDFVGLSETEWKEYSRTYTTGAEQTSMSPLVLVENTANLYLDDFYVYEEGSDVNLLAGAGLEAAIYPAVEDMKVHLNNAENNNVAVSLLLSPHYLENIAAANGIPLTSDDQATFIRFDINNAKVKEIIEAHIRGVLSNIKDYTCIDSICISNEPWFDTRWFDDYTDDFKAYAIEKHGSEDAAKSAYGLYSFQSITMPETNWFGNYKINARAYDWMEFNDKVFTEWHNWMAGIVREYFPNTPIHSKVMENIVSSGETKERVELARGTDYEMFSEFSDYSGIDGSNYSTEDYYELMFLYDYLDSVVGKPIYNSETHIIKDYNGTASNLDEFSADTTKKALYKMWQGAIHGRSMSTVWAWQRHYADDANNSAFYGGLMFRPDLVNGLGQMNLDFARLSDEIAEIQKNSDKVAIFYSKPSRLYTDAYITKVIEVYKELINNGYDVSVVTEKSIDKLSGYDTLIIPGATHTTSEALASVESFIAKGGKVLYTGYDVLSYDEYENRLSNTNVMNGGAVYSISALASDVTLKDVSTGTAPSDIEWQYSVTEDRILVNAVNKSSADKNIEVYYKGTKLGNMNELINNNAGIETVTLNSFVPQLLEYSFTSEGPAELKDLTFDGVRNKLEWKAKGADFASVNIYKYNADKTVEFMCNTTSNGYNYSEAGTYIVSPVLKDGTELTGKIITTEDLTKATNIEILDAKSQYANILVENLTEHFVRGKIVVEILDVYEDVIASGYGNTFVKPNGYQEIKMSLAGNGTPDCVKVTLYDDMGNVINEEYAGI